VICDWQYADKDRSIRRQFNRQIDIPQNVDPASLRSTLSKDGVLQVHSFAYHLHEAELTTEQHTPIIAWQTVFYAFHEWYKLSLATWLWVNYGDGTGREFRRIVAVFWYFICDVWHCFCVTHPLLNEVPFKLECTHYRLYFLKICRTLDLCFGDDTNFPLQIPASVVAFQSDMPPDPVSTRLCNKQPEPGSHRVIVSSLQLADNSTRLNMYGPRDFAISGPSAWNSLPDLVRNPNSTFVAFWRLLDIFVRTVLVQLQRITSVCL